MIENGRLVIPKPERAIHYDTNGNAYDVFRFKLMDGCRHRSLRRFRL